MMMTSTIIGSPRGSAPFPISILDFAMAGRGYTAAQALSASVDLARMADKRGFNRYWIAEHHSMPGVTTSSPALLLARLVGETKQIRLGAGGMMLPNFPPLVVAEQFGLLAALAPDRIDLGIGRAPGTDSQTAAALRRGKIGTEDFPAQLKELLSFLDDSFPQGHPYKADVYAVPGPRQNRENGVVQPYERPPLWLLGSSDYSAFIAAKRGFPFAFAAHLADQNVEIALEVYRRNFRPSNVLQEPYVMASFGVMVSDDLELAKSEAWAYSHAMMRMSSLRSFVVPTAKEAADYHYSPMESSLMDMWSRKILCGTPNQVVAKIVGWQHKINANEIMVLNLGHSLEAIHRSAQLIADGFGLPGNYIG